MIEEASKTVEYLLGFGAGIALGCSGTYNFMCKTMLKNANERLDERDIWIEKLEKKIIKLERMVWGFSNYDRRSKESQDNQRANERRSIKSSSHTVLNDDEIEALFPDRGDE